MILFMESGMSRDAFAELVQELLCQDVKVRGVRVGTKGFEAVLVGSDYDTDALKRKGVQECLNGDAGAKFLAENCFLFCSPTSFFNWGV